MEKNQQHHFSKWRAMFWPIHNYEMKKYLPMALIMFAFLFNYTVLRDTKDVLVVNSVGAHIIPFLKLYCVTPAAVLFVVLYAKLCNVFNKENIFYVIVLPFVIFFGLFGFIIYPNVASFHPNPETIKALHDSYPAIGAFIDIYANWTYSLFYVLAEIWGSAMISLLFWQFANQVTKMTEAKRFYALFPVVGNFGTIFAGQTENFSNHIHEYIDIGTADHYVVSLKILMVFAMLMGFMSMALYRYMHTNVLTDPLYFDQEEAANKPTKKKAKLSLGESAKLIFSSPELGLIVLLVLSYGISINLVELQWKNQIKLYYAGDNQGYHAFMGTYSTFVGIFCNLFIIFVGANVLRNLSWFKAAIITPAMVLVSGSIFFAFILGKDMFTAILANLNFTAVGAAAMLGAVLVMMSKAVKYSLFDPTKEMAYIPLDDELKTKGKAAVDVLGGRLGKAGGAFIQSTLTLLLATTDVIVMAPITSVIFIGICFIWVYAVKALSKKVVAANKKKEQA